MCLSPLCAAAVAPLRACARACVLVSAPIYQNGGAHFCTLSLAVQLACWTLAVYTPPPPPPLPNPSPSPHPAFILYASFLSWCASTCSCRSPSPPTTTVLTDLLICVRQWRFEPPTTTTKLVCPPYPSPLRPSFRRSPPPPLPPVLVQCRFSVAPSSCDVVVRSRYRETLTRVACNHLNHASDNDGRASGRAQDSRTAIHRSLPRRACRHCASFA